MRLYEQVGFNMRVIILGLGQFERDPGAQLAEEGVLLVAYGETLVLCSRRENLQQSFQLGLLVERHAEQL